MSQTKLKKFGSVHSRALWRWRWCPSAKHLLLVPAEKQPVFKMPPCTVSPSTVSELRADRGGPVSCNPKGGKPFDKISKSGAGWKEGFSAYRSVLVRRLHKRKALKVRDRTLPRVSSNGLPSTLRTRQVLKGRLSVAGGVSGWRPPALPLLTGAYVMSSEELSGVLGIWS